MTKTPDQDKGCAASQRAVDWYIRLLTEEPAVAIKEAYQVGYQAAKELYAAKLKEANDTIYGLGDECEGLKTIIYDYDETNLPTLAKWISVKERLPEVFKVYDFFRESNCVLITVAKESDQQTSVNPYVTVAHLAQFKSEEPMWTTCVCSVSGNNFEPNEWKLDQVIYWQPLPEAPKGEK